MKPLRQTLKAGADAEFIELLTGLLSSGLLSYFSYVAQIHPPKGSIAHSGLGLSHKSIVKVIPLHLIEVILQLSLSLPQ